MVIDIALEELFGGAKDGKIGKISIESGKEICVGDALFQIESNKGNTTFKSKHNGKILNLKVDEGDKVKIGDTLAQIESSVDTAQNKSNTANSGVDYFNILLKPQKKELQSDITIIGGGPGGYVAAIQAAKLGANVVLIEKEKVGGTCLNWGCIPTKALVKSSEVYNELKDANKYGVKANEISVDINKVIERKNNIVSTLVQGVEFLLNKNGVKVIRGQGKIIDKNLITVKEKNTEFNIKSKNIIIATGSETFKLPIKGCDLKNVITSKELLDIDKLPEKMVIIGGGIIGMEFAFIFRSFGVDVSVIEYFDSIIFNLDEDICTEITKYAEEAGIKVFTGSKVEGIAESVDGDCIVNFAKDGETKYISGDKVLMAVGRQPYFAGLFDESLGIELNPNKKGIKVDPKLMTNVQGIYAIGDVTNKVQLAHVASHQGMVAVKNILGKNIDMDYSTIPSVVFTNPEIAVVGICEKSAKEQGLNIEIGKFPFAANGKALTLGDTRGFVKIIKNKENSKVIGCSIIGPHASDLIAEVSLAIQNGLTAENIIETIHAHPTVSESVFEAALALEGGSLHFA